MGYLHKKETFQISTVTWNVRSMECERNKTKIISIFGALYWDS